MPSSPASAETIPDAGPPTAPPSSSTQTDPLEAKKTAALEAKIAALDHQIKEIEEKQREIDGRLKTKDPQATVQAHIKLLHDYNEIRDVGQGLMGIIADNRGVRVRDVYQDFDVGEGD
ncbi:hypothetical protein IMSHALPRED_000216 [Imshaugia aleurites]|uniref:Swi5-domain-containing protein n=1 Tax=Imshaugia aleurites TaxID=172621 RepID=A0A8H3EFY3_9LECA|nr:hypothetical protein IMSHALPRED_000216 [Imshaugia aleurites]